MVCIIGGVMVLQQGYFKCRFETQIRISCTIYTEDRGKYYMLLLDDLKTFISILQILYSKWRSLQYYYSSISSKTSISGNEWDIDFSGFHILSTFLFE